MKNFILLLTAILSSLFILGQCHYVVDMQDSYGDGWNGASIDVSVNGTFVANWGLATGSAGSDSIATLSGDIVEFTFNDGAWDSEITFQIIDPSGAVLGLSLIHI